MTFHPMRGGPFSIWVIEVVCFAIAFSGCQKDEDGSQTDVPRVQPPSPVVHSGIVKSSGLKSLEAHNLTSKEAQVIVYIRDREKSSPKDEAGFATPHYASITIHEHESTATLINREPLATGRPGEILGVVPGKCTIEIDYHPVSTAIGRGRVAGIVLNPASKTAVTIDVSLPTSKLETQFTNREQPVDMETSLNIVLVKTKRKVRSFVQLPSTVMAGQPIRLPLGTYRITATWKPTQLISRTHTKVVSLTKGEDATITHDFKVRLGRLAFNVLMGKSNVNSDTIVSLSTAAGRFVIRRSAALQYTLEAGDYVANLHYEEKPLVDIRRRVPISVGTGDSPTIAKISLGPGLSLVEFDLRHKRHTINTACMVTLTSKSYPGTPPPVKADRNIYVPPGLWNFVFKCKLNNRRLPTERRKIRIKPNQNRRITANI